MSIHLTVTVPCTCDQVGRHEFVDCYARRLSGMASPGVTRDGFIFRGGSLLTRALCAVSVVRLHHHVRGRPRYRFVWLGAHEQCHEVGPSEPFLIRVTFAPLVLLLAAREDSCRPRCIWPDRRLPVVVEDLSKALPRKRKLRQARKGWEYSVGRISKDLMVGRVACRLYEWMPPNM